MKFFTKNLPFYFSCNDSSLQIIGATLENDILKVESVAFGKIPLDIVKNGEIIQPKSMLNMLKVLLNNSQPKKIQTNYCYISLADEYVFSKFLRLPKVKKTELESTIKYMIKDFLPYRLEEVYLDWQPLSTSSNDNIELNVSACKRKIIDSYLEVLKLGQIYPIGFEPESQSLARLANLNSCEPSLIIYFGEKSITFSFVEKSSLIFVTSFQPSLQQDLEEEIISKLVKVAKYWQSNFGSVKLLSHIYLSGLVQKEFVIGHAIEENFKLKAEKLSLPVTVPQLVLPNRLQRLAPLVGLALSQKNQDQKTILLIPEKIKKDREVFHFHQKIKTLLKLTIIFLSAIMTIYFYVFLLIFFKKLQAVNALSGWEKVVFTSRQTKLEKNTIQLNKKILSLQEIVTKEKLISPALENLPANIPVGIVLTEISYDPQTKIISLKGTASSRQDILALEQSLSSLGKVNIPLSSFEEKENSKFQATINLK